MLADIWLQCYYELAEVLTMKKTIVAFIIALCMVHAIFAIGEVRFGVKTMALVSNFTFENITLNNESCTGVMAGAVVVFYPMDNLLVECEALFALGGYKTDEGEYTITSVKMPALLTFAPIEFFAVYAGPCLNILATARNPLDENIEKELSPLYFSIHTGAQVSFSESFFVDFRFIKGLNSAAKNADIKMIENSLAIGIGVLF